MNEELCEVKCPRTFGSWLAALAPWLVLTGFANAAHAVDLSVTQINQVSSVRFTRTLFDYTYTINVSNSGPARTNVVATVTSSASATTVQQGVVSLGSIAAGAAITSSATFTIRQDRTVLFDPNSLHWQFTYDQPPTLSAVPNQSVVAGSTLNLQLQGSDPAGKALSYSYTPSIANASLSPSSGAFSFTPTDSQVGTTSVTFTVSNGHLSASQTAQIAVTSRFKPPVITSAPTTVAQATSAYSYPVIASDPQQDVLTYSLPTAPAGMTIDAGTGRISWTPAFDQAGTAPVTVQVTNQHNLSASQSFSIAVAPGAGPRILPVADATVVVGNSLRIQLIASSASGAKLTFSITPSVANASVSSTGAFVFTPTSAQAGDIRVTFSVSDGFQSAQAAATIHVRLPNQPPQITSTPAKVATENAPYSYPVQATDPQGEVLTYSLATAPSGMVIDVKSGSISWTPAPGQFGIRAVDVRVTNAQGLSADQSYWITVTAAADHVSPIVKIQAPTAALVNSTVAVTAAAADNVGVTKLTWYVNDVKITDQSSAPYSVSYTAPGTAAQQLKFRAVAFDAAGNSGSDTAVVTAVSTPDTTPPIIADVLLPATAAPGETVIAHADVTDDRGVASVAFNNGSTALGTVTLSPYEVSFSVPTNAPVGSTVTVSVIALDTSGNQATAQASLKVIATPSTAAPNSVTVSAPANAVAGQTFQVAGSGVDAQGILKIVFLVDGVPFAEANQPPYQVNFTVPVGTVAGRQFSFVAKAVDFGSRSTSSNPAITEVVSTKQGVIAGAVYDDSIGQPLGGVTVSVLSSGNQPLAQPLTAVTDGLGRFQFQVAEGLAYLAYQKASYTAANRIITVSGDTLNLLFDARLTSVPAGTQVNPLAATKLSANDGTVVQIDAGSIANPDILTLTPLSGQSLPASLPLGWSPLAAYELGPVSEASYAPIHVNASRALGSNDIVARWDNVNHQWVRLDANSSGGKTAFNIPAAGSFALVRGDTQPQAPTLPSAGQPLTGVTGVTIPATATAQILPSPDVLFLQPGAKSAVSAALKTSAALPSGTAIKVDFSEDYEKTDNTRLIPPGNTQDLLLYQTQSGLQAGFVASPSQIFDSSLLRTGLIKLAAHTAGSDGQGVVGSAGGTVSSSDGATVVVPSGALRDPTPVHIRSLTGVPASLAADARFTFVGGVSVDLQGGVPSIPFGLSMTVNSSITNASQLLWVRPVQIGSNSGLLFVGLATLSGGRATLGDAGTGLPLPLATAEGPYYLLQSTQPFGYVTGRVLGFTTQAFVKAGDLPVVGEATAGTNAYAAIAYTGGVVLNALEPSSGLTANASVTVAQAQKPVIKDLTLQAGAFSVASVTPANGAASVPVGSSITVRFTQAVDPTTVTSANFSITGANGAIAGSINVSADKLGAAFTPTAPFPDGRPYTVRLAAAIHSATATTLAGNQPDGSYTTSFTTISQTAPPAPAAGSVNVQFTSPTQASITGAAGAAAAGTIVSVTDSTTGATTTVTAASDGSFRLTLGMTPGDKIAVSFADTAGNTTAVPVKVPVVPVNLALSPTSVLFINLDSSVGLTATATFSDGSVQALQSSSALTLTVADPSIAKLASGGVVTPGADGTTRINAQFAANGIQAVTSIPVTTATSGTPVISASVNSEGGVLTTADGSLQISVPPLALVDATQITVSQLSIPTGTTVDANGTAVTVISAYKFEPEIVFESPITMIFQLPQNSGDPSGIAVYRASDELPGDLAIDSLAADDLEGPTQFVDRDANQVVVSTNSFSYRFLTNSGSTALGTPTTSTQAHPSSLMTDGGALLQLYDKPGKYLDGREASVYCVPKLAAGSKTTSAFVKKRAACKSTELTVPKLAPSPASKDLVVWHHTTSPIKVRLTVSASWSASISPTQSYVFKITGQMPALEQGASGSDTAFLTSGSDSICHPLSIWSQQREYVQTNSATAFTVSVYPVQSCSVQNATAGSTATFSLAIGSAFGSTDPAQQSVSPVGAKFSITGASISPVLTEHDLIVNVEQSPGQANYTTDKTGAFIVGPQFLVDSAGRIVRFYAPNIQTNHAPGANQRSVGIEIINSGHQYDFYPGAMLDGVLGLTDYLISDSSPAFDPALPGLVPGAQSKFRTASALAADDLISALRSQPDWGGDLDQTKGIVGGGIFDSDAPLSLASSQAVVRHRDTDRDYNCKPGTSICSPAGAANGTRFRRADASGSNFSMEAMTAALRYDFPGVILTNGGNVHLTSGGNTSPPSVSTDTPGNAGHVALVSGFRPEGVTVAGPPSAATAANGLNCNQAGIAASEVDIGRIPHSVGEWQTICKAMLASSFAGSSPTSAPVFDYTIDYGSNVDDTALGGNAMQIGNLIVNGQLTLSNTTLLRISGLLYVSPTGVVRVAQLSTSKQCLSSRNLTIEAAGPVIVHGRIDLSGCDQSIADGQAATNGGSLEIYTRALSPLQVPTILAMGGSIGSADGVDLLTNPLPSIPAGGSGGNVVVMGSPGGQVWVSGTKASASAPIACDYQKNPSFAFNAAWKSGAAVQNDAGLLFPIVSTPEEALYYSDSLDPSCNRPPLALVTDIPIFSPNFGLAITHGRGIVTSGGNGASFTSIHSRLAGGAGGDGGNIVFSFPPGHAGAVRFRDVTLVSGGGAGVLKKRITYVNNYGTTEAVFDPETKTSSLTFVPSGAVTVPFFQLAGGAGGVGTPGALEHSGGDGGTGGHAGSIFINPAANIATGQPLTNPSLALCESSSARPQTTLFGHSGGVPFVVRTISDPLFPKTDAVEPIGLRATFCSTPRGGTQIPALTLMLATEFGTTTNSNGITTQTGDARALVTGLCKPDPSNSAPCLLGGSGGLAGGSVSHLVVGNTERAFEATGTAGSYGQQGPRGILTLPPSLWSAISSGLAPGNTCASAMKCP